MEYDSTKYLEQKPNSEQNNNKNAGDTSVM